MQKQKKQLIIVCVLLLACIAAYFGLQQYNKTQKQKEKEKEEAATITITDFKAEDVTSFSYPLKGKELSFTKTKEGDWTYDGNTKIDLDESTIKTMLEEVQNLKAEEKIKVSNAKEKEEYGLNKKSDVLTFTVKDKTIKLTLGMENSVTQQYYLESSEDSENIFLINSNLATTFSKEVKDLKAKDEQKTSDTSETTENKE